MTHPEITVIIPTRERVDVLESALRTIVNQDYDSLEILVSDNFSQDETKDLVKSIKDPRIKYINTGKRLSMSHNWEFALSQIEGGWVTFIGDDDGMLPGAIPSIADIMRSSGEMVIKTRCCTYNWPSASQREELVVPMTSGTTIKNAPQVLKKVLNGRAKYSKLPMIYAGGFIPFSIMTEIRKKTGAFFRAASPDVYSGMAIAKVINNYIFCKEPLVINGSSRHSTGTSYFSVGGNNSRPKEKYLSEENIPFHPNMPLCSDGSYPASLQALVYEANLQSSGLGGDWKVAEKKQLEIILATSGKNASSVKDWGRLFSEQHGLNYAGIERNSKLRKILLLPELFLTKNLDAMRSVITSRLKLNNVFNASIAASVIKSSPSRLDTVRFFSRHLYDALLKNPV